MTQDFIPGTMEREIAKGIFFRPVRSWHSNTFAGEGIYRRNGDGSGCLIDGTDGRGNVLFKLDSIPLLPSMICNKPLSVTHRLYWRKGQKHKSISAILSYPNGLSICDHYFWETLGTSKDGDIERFDTEEEMERKIIKVLRASKWSSK